MAVEIRKNQAIGTDKFIEEVCRCYYKIAVKEYLFINDVRHCE